MTGFSMGVDERNLDNNGQTPEKVQSTVSKKGKENTDWHEMSS